MSNPIYSRYSRAYMQYMSWIFKVFRLRTCHQSAGLPWLYKCGTSQPLAGRVSRSCLELVRLSSMIFSSQKSFILKGCLTPRCSQSLSNFSGVNLLMIERHCLTSRPSAPANIWKVAPKVTKPWPNEILNDGRVLRCTKATAFERHSS